MSVADEEDNGKNLFDRWKEKIRKENVPVSK